MTSGESIYRLFTSLRGALARAVLGIVPPKEVEDVVQETYVRVCQVAGRDEIREPRSFLFRTARNLALDHAKRAETRLAFGVGDVEAFVGPDCARSGDETFDRVASEEAFFRFCEAVRELPVQCRRAFVLKKVYGYSQRDIAKAMHLSENTVEKHIALGIRRCSAFMAEHRAQHEAGGRDRRERGARPRATVRRGRRA